jgi:hypothetical protein
MLQEFYEMFSIEIEPGLWGAKPVTSLGYSLLSNPELLFQELAMVWNKDDDSFGFCLTFGACDIIGEDQTRKILMLGDLDIAYDPEIGLFHGLNVQQAIAVMMVAYAVNQRSKGFAIAGTDETLANIIIDTFQTPSPEMTVGYPAPEQ